MFSVPQNLRKYFFKQIQNIWKSKKNCAQRSEIYIWLKKNELKTMIKNIMKNYPDFQNHKSKENF